MSNQKDGSIFKEISERCRKQDPTLKIMFNPEQMIIGNYSPKLTKNRPLIIEQNSNRKISMRLYIAADLMVGYEGRDLGIALTQLDNISVKDEEQENPAALTCTMKSTCMDRIWKAMTGLQQEVEKSFRENRGLSRNITFILNSWPNEQDTFVKVSYGVGDEFREHKFDFEVGKTLLLNDVHAAWSQSISEQWTRRPLTTMSHTQKLVTEMDTCAWVQWLANQKLRKTQSGTGFINYTKVETKSDNRHLKKNSHTQLLDQLSEVKKAQKIHKPANKHFGKLIRSGPRTLCRSVWLVADEKNLGAEKFEHYDATYIRQIVEERGEKVKRRINGHDKTFTVIETEIVEEDEKRQKVEIPNDYHYNPSTSYTPNDNLSVEYVEEQMRHLGETVHDVVMNDEEAIGIQNIPGDYRYYESHENNGMPPFWAPNGSLDTNTMNDEELMKCFFMPVQQPPAQGDFQPATKNVFVTPAPLTPKTVVAPPSSDRVTPDTQLFTFPPKHLAIPGIDPVVLLVKDVRTLDRKEFVNDNAMSFMLNYIAVYMIDKTLMSKIHMCNTFFYVNLTRHLPPLCFSLRKPIDKLHHEKLVDNCSRVFRWTKKFDVFAKDYIVIPINEDFHWLLITVFNPAGAIVDMSNEEASRAAPKCYIAFFDPLSGLDPVKRNHMCHCIKTYLVELYRKTKAPGQPFAPKNPSMIDEDRLVVMRPKNTPIQNNFYDCGLYTLHYIEGLFCYPDRPVSVHDFPDFDWAERYPQANAMADLMRDKIYNLVVHTADKTSRSRLERFERHLKLGLSQEGSLRKGRRHSAAPRHKRHSQFYGRHYSANPPNRSLLEDPMFSNPRDMAEMPITQKVRQLKWPEENFPVIY